MRSLLAVILSTFLLGCPSPGLPDGGNPCADVGEPGVDVGVPDSIRFLDFEALPSGGDIPLSSNGQTFLAVQLALRTTNFDDAAMVVLTVTRQDNGMSTTETTMERMRCRDDGFRYVVPVVVTSEDLGSEVELQDGAIDVSTTVTDDSGNTASASGSGIVRRL